MPNEDSRDSPSLDTAANGYISPKKINEFSLAAPNPRPRLAIAQPFAYRSVLV